ncbi:hypothetical protein QZH41_016422 [Actinostola sp. cb2023]|nr:hypothetical protein QZH41_016422 [Actinostola sp. cb2023]
MKEYLSTLNTRSKWIQEKRNFKVGDIVLMIDQTNPRGKWPLARVTEVFTGSDTNVRVVKTIYVYVDKGPSTDNSNSLANFVMAIHNTSQRAKQVLRNFRRRTIDASSFYSTGEEPADTLQDSRQDSIDEGTEEDPGERDSEASGASGDVSDGEKSIGSVSDSQEHPG